MRSTPVIVLIVAILIALSFPSLAVAGGVAHDERDEKIEQLERMLKELAGYASAEAGVRIFSSHTP